MITETKFLAIGLILILAANLSCRKPVEQPTPLDNPRSPTATLTANSADSLLAAIDSCEPGGDSFSGRNFRQSWRAGAA